MKRISVIGAGLAGSEAANYLLRRGYEVDLYERRPLFDDGAHTSGDFAELVCSNSLKSRELTNACGLLKEEMRKMSSLTMASAARSEVPSGNALGVDRDLFAKDVTARLSADPHLHLHREDAAALPAGIVIVATGPLTSEKLLGVLSEKVGSRNLSFFDASAPIVEKSSLDFSKVYFKSRFEQGDSAYINCPFSKTEYVAFVRELLGAQKTLLHEFDTRYFEGCLPIEVMAARGEETLRHGPLKPFGLATPEHPDPYAVAQLRQDSKLGDYYNIVGFQTNLTYAEQKRVFSLIPGLENASFLRFGLMHRNAYLNAPVALNEDLSLRRNPDIFIAGQLSGVEGYVESAAMGIIAAVNAARRAEGRQRLAVPSNTVTGALIDYILHSSSAYFAPMNANWALMPNSAKADRQETIMRSLQAIQCYWQTVNE